MPLNLYSGVDNGEWGAWTIWHLHKQNH